MLHQALQYIAIQCGPFHIITQFLLLVTAAAFKFMTK